MIGTGLALGMTLALATAGASAAPARTSAGGADGSTNQWPMLHVCTLDAGVVAEADAPAGVAFSLHLPAGSGKAPTLSQQADAHDAQRAAADHAINTKGTGAAGRVAADHAINTKGTGATGRAAADHAINTKGTGMAGRAAADHAINTKGTGMAGRVAGRCVSSRADAATATRGGFGDARTGWNCSLSSAAARPVIRIGWLAQPAQVDRAVQARLLPRGAAGEGMRIPCRGADGAPGGHELVVATAP